MPPVPAWLVLQAVLRDLLLHLVAQCPLETKLGSATCCEGRELLILSPALITKLVLSSQVYLYFSEVKKKKPKKKTQHAQIKQTHRTLLL